MEKEQEKSFELQELCKKYNINLEALEKEQKNLAKNIELKDTINFNLADKFGAIGSSFFENKIISSAVIINPSLETVEQEYFYDILRFPYIPGFRAYRELPAMMQAFQKLDEKPDVVFIQGHGIAHPRLGLASHFSILTGVPTIGITDSLLSGTIKSEDIIFNNKKVGKVLQSKQGSKPLFISPGNLITIKSAYELAKKLIKEPHKFPEPMHIASKYAKEVRDEIYKK